MSDERVQKRVPVQMWVEEIRGTDRYFQRSANLSVGGLYLDGTIPHARGTVVQLQFTLPGEAEPCELRGEIVGDPDEEHLGMHVKFLDLDSGMAERLRTCIARSATPSGDQAG